VGLLTRDRVTKTYRREKLKGKGSQIKRDAKYLADYKRRIDFDSEIP